MVEYAELINPKGSKYPMFEVSGSKTQTLIGVWDQRAYILGAQILGELYTGFSLQNFQGKRGFGLVMRFRLVLKCVPDSNLPA